MAASSIVTTRRATDDRGAAARAAARTAPRGTGLAPVVPLPVRGPVRVGEDPSSLAPRSTVACPDLALVPPLRRPRRTIRVGVVAALVTSLLLALGATALGGSDRGEPVAMGHVVLQPGETLWDIAVRSAPAGVDPRRQLDTLRRLNGFGSGQLDAWTVVLIPAV